MGMDLRAFFIASAFCQSNYQVAQSRRALQLETGPERYRPIGMRGAMPPPRRRTECRLGELQVALGVARTRICRGDEALESLRVAVEPDQKSLWAKRMLGGLCCFRRAKRLVRSRIANSLPRCVGRDRT